MIAGDPTIALRPAGAADADLLREWRNDPATVAASGTAKPVAADEHSAWLQAVLAAPDTRLWIAESGGKPAGQVRFDRVRGYVYEISVSIDAGMRGTGLGRALIARACELLFAESNATTVISRVRPENAASVAAFLAAGFKADSHEGGFDRLTLARPDEWAPGWRSVLVRD